MRMRRVLYGFAVMAGVALCTGGSAPPDARTGDATGWWRVFFTAPGSPRNDRDGPEAAFIRLLGAAERTIHGAFYDISSPEIARAFISAAARGVSVRLVTDDGNAGNDEIARIRSAGIPVVADERRGFMHNKFAIIDGEIVWTGSFNLTRNCARKNNNNAIMIRSPELARIYEAEFDEMFTHRVFGNRAEPGPFAVVRNRYYVRIGESHINVHFSPENGVERIIAKRIDKAKKSICFMLFSFTSDPIGEAMIAKFKSGVPVHGIFERRGAGSASSEYTKMRTEGLPVMLDRNPRAMHHKVLIIDERLVITGSYNFSKNADRRNDENIIIIDNPEIAAEYLAEYRRLAK
ncbi:MAG TPA: phospholipase D-like domain-containing protein [Spirochaetota bacterium]|nr:phospholipase D-like domain-containing protein [Spirochaetota bacterium]HNT09251.1 phospholipase D-like domain-containing protein [Spirochaetota bacterium]HNV46331.1 phospholipase D-like domain-containing protein [Spirochaetota bacterium]HPI22627.1 phospholipase D-like domain-containing protein [Spirochaetota bacterium]HPU89472.1 phospholipase D-like domain-containing protein [Spirochaetota bacterium]